MKDFIDKNSTSTNIIQHANPTMILHPIIPYRSYYSPREKCHNQSHFSTTPPYNTPPSPRETRPPSQIHSYAHSPWCKMPPIPKGRRLG
mmetsp:Transcript_4266/g.8637  ORF Transcript_4266/g.8637 Transcript_4266/m.8637 type:complete len:89 (+) Transcript_4266:845-1111(+)